MTAADHSSGLTMLGYQQTVATSKHCCRVIGSFVVVVYIISFQVCSMNVTILHNGG